MTQQTENRQKTEEWLQSLRLRARPNTVRAKPATIRPTLPGETVGIHDLHHVHYREVAIRRRGASGECDWWDSLMPGDDYHALRLGAQLGGIILAQYRVDGETRLIAKLRRVGA